MNILVTGAAGFIGFHTIKSILSEANIVVGIDSINDYYDVNLKLSRLGETGITPAAAAGTNLTRSDKYPNYYFQKLDITNIAELKLLFERYKFNRVIHLAAQPGVRYSLENPHAYIQANLVGFMNILECCRLYNAEHLVYASSSSVYGMNTKTPFNEDDRVDYPVSLYAATKKSNELMAHTYSHLYQLSTTGIRFFTVYGPWGRPDMAPMLFADSIYSGKEIKVFNGGDLHRDFTYIDDIVKGVTKIVFNIPSKNDDVPFYRIFNIGNSTPVNLMEFIRCLEDEIGIKANLTMYPMQPGDVKITFADVTRLQKKVGYKPTTNLREGITEFVAWYKKLRCL